MPSAPGSALNAGPPGLKASVGPRDAALKGRSSTVVSKRCGERGGGSARVQPLMLPHNVLVNPGSKWHPPLRSHDTRTRRRGKPRLYGGFVSDSNFGSNFRDRYFRAT